jgi:hypothetical protein
VNAKRLRSLETKEEVETFRRTKWSAAMDSIADAMREDVEEVAAPVPTKAR